MNRAQWRFYLGHSLRDLLRNGSRTVFALFCIATGVAAVVALRSLGLMIGDELTLNLAQINRGDIQITASDDYAPNYVQRSSQNDYVFTDEGVNALRDWASENDVEIQFGANLQLLQVRAIQPETGQFGGTVTLIPILIEPDKWPFYDQIYSSDPSITPLSELFPPNERVLVMSRRSALENRISVGDEVVVTGSTEPLRVVALVADEIEGSAVLRNGPAGLLGFVYYPLFRADEIGLDPLPQQAYIKIPLGRSVESVERLLRAEFGRGIPRTTTIQLARQNQRVADLVNDLILVMGLSSILIGGMGIINTMNVIVARRTLEIAVLKTLGLKAWRVSLLFFVQSAMMGIIGSIIGIIGGIVLSYFIRGVGEEVMRTSLSWRAYPEAWFSGMSLGLIITLAFGFLPTLNAGQVRPAGVLRPNEIQLPNAGLTRTLGTVILVMLAFGLTLNTITRGDISIPITWMLGLGGFIIGLFGGVMLANEGIMARITPEMRNISIARRGVAIFTAGTLALLMIGLAAGNAAFEQGWGARVIYGIPLLISGVLGASLWLGARQNLGFGLLVAGAARQLLLLGGALVLGGLVGGLVFALWRAVLGVLYPNEAIPPNLGTAQAVSLILFIMSAFVFRWRGRGAAGMVGLALIGAGFLSVIGTGFGELLIRLLGRFAFWEEVQRQSNGIIIVQLITLALAGVFVVMLGVVWLMGKMPSGGQVDIKLGLRNINARRNRTASTMLGLTAGIAALALITLTTSGVIALLEGQLETNIGGNVVVLSRNPEAALAVSKRLEGTLEGVNSFTQYNFYSGRILAVDGEPVNLNRFPTQPDAASGNRFEFGRQENEPGFGFGFVSLQPSHAPPYIMKAGRYLTDADMGEPVMVMRETFPGAFLERFNIGVGSVVTWRLTPPPQSGLESFEVSYRVIGVIDRNSQDSPGDGLQVPMGSVPESVPPESIITIADIQPEYIDAAMADFAQITNAFALEVSFLVGLIENLIDQLIAVPALVAILALVAGVAIIANTVALDTQERRRQIGVMKAVGLKGRRVLAQLMFENAFIGLVSGLIGVGIGILATLLIGVLGDANQLDQTLQLWPALRLIILAVGVALAATLASAWSAARESPMDVLRYE